MLLRQLAEGQRRVDAEVGADGRHRLAHQALVAAAPRRDGAVGQRLGVVGDDAEGVEIPGGAQALARLAGAVRRVEREGAGRHLGHADAAHHARQLPREEPVAAVQRVDHHHVVGQAQRHVDRLGEAALDAAAHDQAVHDDVDVVVAAAVERDVFLERSQVAVDARLGEPARAHGLQLFLELALAAADDGRHHVDARVLRVGHHQVDNALHRLGGDLAPAGRAVRHADVGEEQPQVVVDLGDRPHGGARVGARGLLLDRDGRRQPLDEVDVGLLHLLEELARVGRERLDVAALPLGVEGVEGQRRLARARQARDDHELVARNVDVDVLEVVDSRAPNKDPVVRHGVRRGPRHGPQSVILLRTGRS